MRPIDFDKNRMRIEKCLCAMRCRFDTGWTVEQMISEIQKPGTILLGNDDGFLVARVRSDSEFNPDPVFFIFVVAAYETGGPNLLDKHFDEVRRIARVCGSKLIKFTSSREAYRRLSKSHPEIKAGMTTYYIEA